MLAICGRREETLHETRALIERMGGHCYVQPCDVREPDQVEALVDDILARLGSVDVLVNNAGGQFQADAETISLNGWRAVHRLSLEAVWSVTRTVAVRSMIPNRRGVILFIGFSPRRGQPGFVHAAAARAGVENLAASLALEWSRYGIRSVCVAPGRSRPRGSSSTAPTPSPSGPGRCRWGASAGPRTSPRCWRFSPRRARATSPARPGRSTAASMRGASARSRHRPSSYRPVKRGSRFCSNACTASEASAVPASAP